MSQPRLSSGFKMQDNVTMVGNLRAVVKSQNSDNQYSVDLRTSECECPDFQFRGVKCKHIRAAEAKAGMYTK